MSRCLLSSSPTRGAGMGACPGAQGAHHWGSPAPDRQWPGTDAPAVIQRVTVGRVQTRPCRDLATEGVPARKPMSVAYRQEYQKAYFCSTGRGNGATGVHQSIL